MPIMNKLTAAYLAGIIDGEGSIDFQKTNEPQCKNGYHYNPRLRIGMIDKKFIEWLKDSFGGCIYQRFGKGKNRNSYTWSIQGKIMRDVLKKVYPYLRLKKQHAEIMMRYWKTKQYIPIYRKNYGCKELTSEARLERDRLFEQLKTFQIKGKNVAAEETERENPSGVRQSDTLGIKQEITI